MKYSKAIEVIEEGLKIEPEEGTLYYLYAICLFAIDDNDGAIDKLSVAYHLGDDRESVHSLLGDIFMEEERWVEAEQEYIQTLRINPQNAEVHASYALLMLKMNYDKKAELLMKEALRLEPENPEVIRINHFFELAKSNDKETVLQLQNYIQKADSEVAKELQLFIHTYHKKEIKQAQKHITQAYLLDPTNELLKGMLDDIEKQNHLLYRPLHFLSKFGGVAVIWLLGMGTILFTLHMGWEMLSYSLTMVYLLFVVYTWTAPVLVKILTARKR
jgi:tetratricopeptide (TPR) repeat protein